MTGAIEDRTSEATGGDHPGDVPITATDEHVLAAQRGDEDAFVVVYRHVNPALHRYLRVLVGSDAEDVAAETWTQVCRDLASFSGDLDSFRGWVTRIGRNRALDHLRGRQRRPSVPVAPEDLWFLDGPTDVAQEVTDTMSTEAALALVARLPREQAEAVMLRVVLDFDARSAGEIVGRSAGAIRTATYRGLRTLAGLVGPPDPDEEAPRRPRWARPPETP